MITIKINASDCIDDEYGFTEEESRKVIKLLAKYNLDGIEISSGIAGGKISPARDLDHIAYNLDFAEKIADEVSVPIILTGGIRSLDLAEKILAETNIHNFGLTRALTYNPNLINLWKENKNIKSKCICCNKCFVSPGQMCVINP